jgi:hypothetical protein
MEKNETLCLAVANIIRKSSEIGQLVQPEGIRKELIGQSLLKLEGDQQGLQVEDILEQALEENEDLKKIPEREGALSYYSTKTMTESFARILIKRKGDPLLLMAEIVRENSSIYPRPVPLRIFRDSPFDLTQEEILFHLKKMGETEAFQDITQTTTSIGTIFLYSSRYLEHPYAASLAEWLEVGQAENP